LKKNGKPAHSFHITENIVDIICNPTRRILVTVSLDGFIHIWDYITYRLKRVYENPRRDPLHIGLTGSGRLVIGNKDGISVMDIDME